MKNIIIMAMLVVLLMGVTSMFSARAIVGKKVDITQQNRAVLGLKVVSFFIIVLSMFAIYYMQ